MSTTAAPTRTLDTWAAEWPATITLGEAAEEIGFDLFRGDDEELVLHKRLIPILQATRKALRAERRAMEENDSDDFFGSIEAGLDAGGHHVPPVIVLSYDALRDGNHRMLVAQELGLTHIPAYTDETDD